MKLKSLDYQDTLTLWIKFGKMAIRGGYTYTKILYCKCLRGFIQNLALTIIEASHAWIGRLLVGPPHRNSGGPSAGISDFSSFSFIN